MKATKLAPANERERKNLKSTIGLAMRPSTIANAISDTVAKASSPTIRAEPQPHALLSTSARTSAARPALSVPTPA